MKRRAAAIVTALAAAALLPASAGAGLAGVGDKYFPKAGNGGYDVRHYGLDLDFNPVTDELTATARIKSVAKQELRVFHLDYRGPAVSAITVKGVPADFEQRGSELVVQPRAPLRDGHRFKTVVSYQGQPQPFTDPDGSTEGWTNTADGSAALGEPLGSPSWFPCNNHPTDKATYRFRVSVPAGLVAVANGVLTEQTSGGGKETFVWDQRDPMAAYLAVLATGIFDLQESTIDGVPAWTAIDPLQAPAANLGAMEEIHQFLAATFGPYPFGSTGAIVDLNPTLGYALETQSRPYYSVAPGESTVVHEIAHQWYGDSVTLGRWKDIWLNEGFAQYAEWLWTEDQGGTSTAAQFDSLYATPESNEDFWNPPPGDPKPAGLFDETVYTRGAMTLQVLREKIGDADFFDLLVAWHERHRGSHATTPQLRRLAEKISGEKLGRIFREWLYEPGKPPA